MNKHVRIYQAKRGKGKGRWRAQIVARNGKILLTTPEGYVRRRDLENMLSLAKTLIRWP